MRTRTLALVVTLGVGLAGGALWAQHSALSAAYADGGNGTVVTPLDPTGAVPVPNPVVACTPYTYSTVNETDAFDSTRVRSTRTTVSAVVLVHADGTTEVQKVKDKG